MFSIDSGYKKSVDKQQQQQKYRIKGQKLATKIIGELNRNLQEIPEIEGRTLDSSEHEE